MIFIAFALAFAVLTVHLMNSNRFTLAMICMILSGVVPLMLQGWYDRLRSDTHRGGNGAAFADHRVGNGYTTAPTRQQVSEVKVQGDRTLLLLDKMNSDLKEIAADLRQLSTMSTELRVCLIPSEAQADQSLDASVPAP